MTTTVDERGRIVIPKTLRDRLGMGPGAEVEIEAADTGFIVRPKARPLRDPTELLGIINASNRDPDAVPIDPLRIKRIWEGER